MDVFKSIRTRYSVRSYKPEPVEDKKLAKVIEAARLAPTANNLQPFKIIVIHTAGKREELLTIYSRPWFIQAPIILCLCATPGDAWVRKDGRNYYYVDCGIVMDHVVLAATSLGLGTCIVAEFDEINARKVLQIPAESEPVLFTPIGYPADTPRIKLRKPIEDLVKYENW